MTNSPVDLRALLEQLRQTHHQCEDSWYSCPKNPEGCADERQEGCTCGVDEHNALIDSALRSLTQQQQQEAPDERIDYTLSIYKQRDGLFAITSSIPGLFLAGADLLTLLADIPLSVKMLRELNGHE